jgi:subfamily B ATP-binding cassette protein MsbA
VSKRPTPSLLADARLYRRLLTYAWPYRWVFLAAIAGMVVFSSTAGAFAALMKPLFDEGLVARNPQTIRLVPLWILGLFLIRGLATLVAEYCINWVGRKVVYDLRNAVFAQMLRLPVGYYDLHASGGLLSRLLFDVEQIAASVTTAVYSLVRDGLTVAALLIWLLYLNWRLTLVFAIVTPVTAVLVKLMSRGFRHTSQKIQASMGGIAQIAQEAIDGQRVIKAFGAEAVERHAFEQANEHNRRQAMRKVAVSAIGLSLIQFFAAAGLALVVYYAFDVPGITAGTFASYITAVTWMMGPSKRLTKVNEVIQTGLAAAGSVFAVLDEPPEEDSGTRTIERARGRVEYRCVSFRYPNARDEALQDVSFIAEPGEMVALVGPSGGGKTTCLSLLPRFYRPTRGQILLDGLDIGEIQLASLRAQIAVVGQETILFADTIRHNIVYGSPGPVDEARLLEAARAAHVLEFAERLPEGLDTHVGEKGRLLSGGQRQRVAIARALYKDAPILILDEATSALDLESERLVREAIERLMAGRTTLVIAHRLTTVERADRIVVFAAGRVVECGTHRELLARGGLYAQLYRSQFASDSLAPARAESAS